MYDVNMLTTYLHRTEEARWNAAMEQIRVIAWHLVKRHSTTNFNAFNRRIFTIDYSYLIIQTWRWNWHLLERTGGCAASSHSMKSFQPRGCTTALHNDLMNKKKKRIYIDHFTLATKKRSRQLCRTDFSENFARYQVITLRFHQYLLHWS